MKSRIQCGKKTWLTGPRTLTGRPETCPSALVPWAGLLFIGEEENQSKEVIVGTSDPYFLLGFFLFFLYHTIYPISSPGRAKALGI